MNSCAENIPRTGMQPHMAALIGPQFPAASQEMIRRPARREKGRELRCPGEEQFKWKLNSVRW